MDRKIKANEINWNEVYFFWEVARHGSIKEAARTLALSSSTLSEHISALEKDLKVPLFHRQHRKLNLTTEGARLFQYAKQMFEVGHRLIDVASPGSSTHGSIRVGFVPGSARTESHPWMLKYLNRYAPLNVNLSHVTHEKLEKELLSARLDFGFSNRKTERKDLVAHLLSSSPFRLFVPQKSKETDYRTLFSEKPLLAWTGVLGTGSQLDSLLVERTLSPVSVISGDEMSALYRLCKEGVGVGLFSEGFVREMGNGLTLANGSEEVDLGNEELYALWMSDAEEGEAIQRLQSVIKNGTRSRRSKWKPRDIDLTS